MSAKDKFKLLREQEIPELRTRGYLYEHIKTGAQFLSLVNDDKNKVFGVTFRTPPTDSTGVAHIMEHSVLNGSRKYPLKDPFKQLIGSSVNTFLNAFTFPDKTVYPCASAHIKDFYNIVDVYLDTVFYPVLSREAFMQEGWHYEVDGDALTYKGVVFNEMKGSYSDPKHIANNYAMNSLFPDTTYGVDSGGDPARIPDLTYEQFKEFHDTYYHPSNSFAYFYGDDDPEKRFEILEEYLGDFDRKNISSEIALQVRFTEPSRSKHSYPAGEGDKGIVSINWMIGEIKDVVLRHALVVLGYMLTGTPGSPLRKALIDSQLGDDFMVTLDPEDELRQVCFSAGLKGIDPGDTGILETLIFDTLEKLASEGLDQESVDAGLNAVEFSLREVDGVGGSAFPRGLNLCLQSLGMWLHGLDPIEMLAFEKPLNELKQRTKDNPHYFEDLIQKYLLDNTHRSTVTLTPNTTLFETQAKQEVERLEVKYNSLDDSEKERIIKEEAVLKKWQETPDTQEDLAKLPALTLTDLDTKIETVPTQLNAMNDAQVLFHDLETNGIVYIDLGFDMSTLPMHLLSYCNVLSTAFLEVGTSKDDYVSFMQRIDALTGGIATENMVTKHSTNGTIVSQVFMNGRALARQVSDMLALMRDALLHVRLDNKERFKQIVTEAKVGFETSIVDSGHAVVGGRLRSMLSESGWIGEQVGGIDQLQFVRALLKRIDTDWEGVLKDLSEARQLLVNQSSLIVNVTCSYAVWRGLESHVTAFVKEIPSTPVVKQGWHAAPVPASEGLSIPAQVNFVGKGANLYNLGYEFDASIFVIVKFLRSGYLWDTVRLQGGAYGGFCAFDKQSGVFSFLSYRDPNTSDTIARYDAVVEYLRTFELSDADLEKVKIATVGDLGKYKLPDEKGRAALIRHLVGETDESRQETHDQAFNTTLKDFHTFADTLEKLNKQGTISILGSESALKSSDLDLTITNVL